MTSHTIYAVREWMYKRVDENTGEITKEFKAGLCQFMEVITNQPLGREQGIRTCPCLKCRNEKFLKIEIVCRHLYNRGFTPGYYIWLSHGKDYVDRPGNICRGRKVVEINNGRYVGESSRRPIIDENNIDRMVREAFPEYVKSSNVVEKPNPDPRRFFEMLDADNHPIYEGFKVGHSPLSAATRMIGIKIDFNLSEDCVDAIADFFCDYLPKENLAPHSYYAIQKLVSGLGLPYQMIDVCRDNCMIFWREDENLEFCRFCGKERFQVSTGRTRIPYQRMWYLPITDILKRLYQSDRTASGMRWHGEYQFTGDISHPSDAEAWKHFQYKYPDFAREMRNVYFGLCTDGFNPFGKRGRKYSLWPVIVTPYNLPPTLCMKREFLFLAILVPGPNHPRRALDVFLKPLISELQMLWHEGV
ncbi:hypothetical protein V5N11_019494 [Cardamine amara subsp. amara]|uniref:Transposase-associated domain-containing protein n=1 Tax=Cardamine amara subsp. amara TaxID=228776 RepID=A0ABD1C108_CARAN